MIIFCATFAQMQNKKRDNATFTHLIYREINVKSNKSGELQQIDTVQQLNIQICGTMT